MPNIDNNCRYSLIKNLNQMIQILNDDSFRINLAHFLELKDINDMLLKGKKYILTDITMTLKCDYRTVTLYRIKAIKDFNDVKAGNLGGFIEKEENLSHNGNCWVYDNAMVLDCAKIRDNAKIKDNAKILDNVKVCGNSVVSGTSVLHDMVQIKDNAEICDNVELFSGVSVKDNVKISGTSKINNHFDITGDIEIHNDTSLYSEYNHFVVNNCNISKIKEMGYSVKKRVVYKVGTRVKSGTNLKDKENLSRLITDILSYDDNIKYQITNKTYTTDDGHVLHRIRALKEFADVKIGDLGGYIETEDNLSHSGDCWVYDTSKVYENARIGRNAKVSGASIVHGNAFVTDKATVNNHAHIHGNCRIFGSAKILHSEVYDYAEVYGYSIVEDHSLIFNDCKVYDNAKINKSKVYEAATVCNYSEIYNDSEIFGNCLISGGPYAYIDNTKVYGNAIIYKGDITNSFIYDYAIINNGKVVNSHIHGKARVNKHDRIIDTDLDKQ